VKIIQEQFGVLDGQEITAYTLVNDHGMEVTSLNYGCVVTRIVTPDRNGVLENVVLGFDTIEEYVKHSPFFGAVIGRVAGRIQNAEFDLNGETYQLAKTEGPNHLHGGLKGFDKVIWAVKPREDGESVSLEFSYLSKDGEEGYPGNLQMQVTYTLTNDNVFSITYTGETDKATLLNVTNHSYFNLSGELKRDALGHRLTIKSDRFAVLDDKLIPTGELLSVEGTPFDLRAGRKLNEGVVSEHPQNVLVGHGYDHPFVLAENNNREIILVDEESGRTLTVETDQPAVVLYTSNALQGDFTIRGVQADNYLGVCLETQGLPDAIHHENFPTIILEKGEKFQSTTTFIFGIV